jgi:hypothetical protein
VNLKIKQWVMGFVIAVVAFALSFAYIRWSPRKYQERSSLQQVRGISNGHESFVEIYVSDSGSSTFAWQEKASSLHKYLGLAAPLDVFWSGHTIIWHCQDGQASRVELPGGTALGEPLIQQGKLTWKGAAGKVWQWNGQQLQQIAVAGERPAAQPDVDDEDEDEDEEYSKALRKQKEDLKKAGWTLASLRLSKTGLLELPAGNVQIEDQRIISSDDVKTDGDAVTSVSDTLRIYNADARHALLGTEAISSGSKLIDRQTFEATKAKTPFVGLRHNSSSDIEMSFRVSRVLFWPLLIISLPFFTKHALRKNAPSNFVYMPVQRTQFPNLDIAAFDSCSRELEARGFEVLFEGTVTPGTGMVIPGFTRVLVHKGMSLFAEVFQIFPPMRAPSPVRCGINLYFDQGWSLSVGNGNKIKATIFARLPRAVSFSFPGMQPADLLPKLHQLRQQMITDLGIRELTDMSLETYMRYNQSKNDLRLKERDKNFLAKYLRYFLGGKLSPEWRGDWPKEAKRRAAGYGFSAGASIGR